MTSQEGTEQAQYPQREEILEAVRALEFADYSATKADGEDFYDYYAARGWHMNFGLPMQDWRAAFRSWLNKKTKFGSSKRTSPAASPKSVVAEEQMDSPKATPEEIQAIIEASAYGRNNKSKDSR